MRGNKVSATRAAAVWSEALEAQVRADQREEDRGLALRALDNLPSFVGRAGELCAIAIEASLAPLVEGQ